MIPLMFPSLDRLTESSMLSVVTICIEVSLRLITMVSMPDCTKSSERICKSQQAGPYEEMVNRLEEQETHYVREGFIIIIF